MRRRIVVGLDPDREDEEATALAGVICARLDAVAVLAVASPWPEDLASGTDIDATLAGDEPEPFVRARAKLDSADVETRLLQAVSPAEALDDLARSEGAVMIVLGSSRRGAIGRIALGSVSESLLHGGPCAVAIAPRGFAATRGDGSRGAGGGVEIGVAFDGSAESWSALEDAIELAKPDGAGIRLIAVARYPHYGYAASWAVLSEGELHDRDRDEKRQLLDIAARRVPAGIPVSVQLDSGDPGDRLLEAAAGLDLLLVGSRAYGPIRSTLLGSTTRRLFRSAPCPVIAVPRTAVPLAVPEPRSAP